MPKTSKATAPDGQEFPVGHERTDQLDGYTVGFVTLDEAHDLAPMLAVLPTGRCECPHWGYVTKGRSPCPMPTGRRRSTPATRTTCRRATPLPPAPARSSSCSARRTS